MGSQDLNVGPHTCTANTFTSWFFPSTHVFLLDFLFINSTQARIIWKEEHQLRKLPLSDWSIGKSGDFPEKWLMEKNPPHCGQCHPLAGVLGCIWKLTEEAMGNKPVNTLLLGLWFSFGLQVHAWVCTSLQHRLQVMSWNKTVPSEGAFNNGIYHNDKKPTGKPCISVFANDRSHWIEICYHLLCSAYIKFT